MSTWQFVVVQQAARRIAAPDRDGDASIPTADDVDVAAFVDGWLGRMESRVRRDFGRFLAYVEHVAPLREGLAARFSRLSAADQDRVLAATEASSSDLLRAGFD
ncbi:MAG TPA: gluconate 2-dehydrogenase subunit 3 family protein, partial [Polyangiaceae bacterium]